MVGGRAVGLSGKDGGLIIAQKLFHDDNGKKLDIGLVGSVSRVNPLVIEALDREKFIRLSLPSGMTRPVPPTTSTPIPRPAPSRRPCGPKNSYSSPTSRA